MKVYRQYKSWCILIGNTLDAFARLFEIKLDNGKDVLAKIPYPTAGPSHLMTASEVATMTLLRTLVGIPVPRVLSWCSKAEETNVGSEFILMEKAPGTKVYGDPEAITAIDSRRLIHSLVSIEKKLTDFTELPLGSVYFSDDLPPSTPCIPLNLSSFIEPNSESPEEYVVGPSVDRRFWRGERASMSLRRGPCMSINPFVFEVTL